MIRLFENNLNLQYLVIYIDNIPNLYLENFTNGMVSLASDLSEDNLLKRIEDPGRKVSLIKNLFFDLYKVTFFERLNSVEF